jgi:hypothetical protein
MVAYDRAGYDFIRIFVLVMLGTVVAPVSQDYASLPYII